MLTHEEARTILIGLSENPTRDDKAAALSTVLSAKAEPPKTREFAVLLPGDRKADFRVPLDFSADDFELVKAVLDVMRPGLVSTAPPHAVPDSPDQDCGNSANS